MCKDTAKFENWKLLYYHCDKITSKNKTMKRFLLLALIATTMTSCATIFCSTKERVTFDGEVTKPVTMIVDGRQYKNVTLPYNL